MGSVCCKEESKPKPVLEKKSCKFNVKIPEWPYERWELRETPQDFKKNRNDSLTNSDVQVAHHIPTKVGPVFHSFLESFSQQLGIHNREASVDLSEQIKSMLTDSLEDLGKSYKCFEKCKLVQAGSTAEKTKVEAPDEFDFLIILNFFANKECFRTAVTKNEVRIYVKDPTVIDLLPLKCQDHAGTAEFLDINLRSIFMKLFIDIFDSLLPFEWKRISDKEKVPCNSKIASTLHLWSEKFKLYIDIDLCLCLPISAEDCDQAMSMPEHVDPNLQEFFESQILLFRYITDVMEESPIELYAILGRAELSNETVSTRITAPFLELFQFQLLTPEDCRMKAYCLAKCILSAFLPKLCKIFADCKRCCHKLVRSYHIKNIFLFMLKSYKEDDHWKDEKLPIRVLEIFSILKECMISTDDESSYAAAVSTCCFPGTLFLENVTNSGLYDSGSRSFFYTPDSHKPMYQLSSSPVYNEYLSTTGNEEADSLLKEWFVNLNNNPWDAKQLLLDLFSLLKTLNEIELISQTVD